MPATIRQTIPDAWGEHARCPLCAAPGMRVQHQTGCADQLLCTSCGLAFELEMEGARLHVERWPDALPFLHIMVSDDWRTAAELRTLVRQSTSGPGMAASPPQAVSNQPPLPEAPAKAEPAPVLQTPVGDATPPSAVAAKSAAPALNASAISIRIKQLRALGNSPKEIRATLTQGERDPQRVQAILGIIAQMERQEQARQGKKLAWALGILAVVVILLVGAGYVFVKNSQGQNQPAAPGATLQPTQAPNIVSRIMNLNTPVVNYGAVPPSNSSAQATSCPRTAQEAADLFGGKPPDWISPPSSNGWVMVRKGVSTSIIVPKGMKAAYLQLSNKLQLIEVQGPATLSDVYYVAVSCP